MSVAGDLGRRVRGIDLRTLIRTVLLVGLLVVFTTQTEGFWTDGNLYSLMQAFALLGLVAVGLSLTMIAGEFDLSVGAMVAVAGIVAIKTGESSPYVGVAAAVGVGLAFGALNGLLVVHLRISSLVVTIGTLILLTGLAFKLAAGRVVAYERFDVGIRLDERVLEIFSLRSLITLAVIALIIVLLRLTRAGRDIYATGSHRSAAVAAGVPTGRILVAVFCISGACAALAGALLSYSLSSGSPELSGSILLQAASAAIVGGVALSGGIGTASGVAVGALILTVLNNGLALMGASSAAVSLANGLILLGIVLLDARGGGRATDLLRLRRGPPERRLQPSATT